MLPLLWLNSAFHVLPNLSVWLLLFRGRRAGSAGNLRVKMTNALRRSPRMRPVLALDAIESALTTAKHRYEILEMNIQSEV